MDRYQPIDCDFHDELEDASTLKKRVELVIALDDGRHETFQDEIVDLGHGVDASGKAEFIHLKSGRRVRLDRIVSIDGKPRPT